MMRIASLAELDVHATAVQFKNVATGQYIILRPAPQGGGSLEAGDAPDQTPWYFYQAADAAPGNVEIKRAPVEGFNWSDYRLRTDAASFVAWNHAKRRPNATAPAAPHAWSLVEAEDGTFRIGLSSGGQLTLVPELSLPGSTAPKLVTRPADPASAHQRWEIWANSRLSSDLQVLLVGLGHYPKLRRQESLGAIGSLTLWHDLMSDLNLPEANIWLATSLPTRESIKRTSGKPWLDGRTVDSIAQALPRDQVCTSGTPKDIEALVAAFVARLASRPGTTRALVVWTGHGAMHADGSLHFATAASAVAKRPRVGGGTVSSGPTESYVTETLAWDTLAALLEKRPDSVELTVVLDTCFSAAEARTDRQQPKRLSEDAVVLMASQGAQQAREVQFLGRPVGAFSLALTGVLSRWGHAGESWGITPEELVQRASAYLFSLGIPQLPAFDGPMDALRRPLLRNPRSSDTTRAAEDLPGIEIDPGDSGRVYEFTVGATTHLMVATTATQTQGAVDKSRLWWQSLPSGDSFTLSSSTQAPPTSLPSGSKLFKDQAWGGGSPPTSVSGGGWEIQTTSGGAVVGWMYVAGDGSLSFARTGGSIDFASGATFTWKKPLTIPTGTSFVVAACSAL